MGKKAQVTLFIILGIVILLVAVMLIYIANSSAPVQNTAPAPILQDKRIQLDSYLQDTLAEIGKKAVYIAGRNGGYIAPRGDERYKEFEPLPDYQLYYVNQNSFPFALNQDKISLLSKQQIAKKIANYIAYELEIAVNSSDYFKKLEILGKPQVFVSINQNDVSITADYPIRMNNVISSKTAVNIPIRFGMVYNIVSSLLIKIRDNDRYDIGKDCGLYGDNMVNLYLYPGQKVKLHAIRIVDAKPLYDQFNKPFEFWIGIQNNDVQGECVG